MNEQTAYTAYFTPEEKVRLIQKYGADARVTVGHSLVETSVQILTIKSKTVVTPRALFRDRNGVLRGWPDGPPFLTPDKK